MSPNRLPSIRPPPRELLQRDKVATFFQKAVHSRSKKGARHEDPTLLSQCPPHRIIRSDDNGSHGIAGSRLCHGIQCPARSESPSTGDLRETAPVLRSQSGADRPPGQVP